MRFLMMLAALSSLAIPAPVFAAAPSTDWRDTCDNLSSTTPVKCGDGHWAIARGTEIVAVPPPSAQPAAVQPAAGYPPLEKSWDNPAAPDGVASSDWHCRLENWEVQLPVNQRFVKCGVVDKVGDHYQLKAGWKFMYYRLVDGEYLGTTSPDVGSPATSSTPADAEEPLPPARTSDVSVDDQIRLEHARTEDRIALMKTAGSQARTSQAVSVGTSLLGIGLLAAIVPHHRCYRCW